MIMQKLGFSALKSLDHLRSGGATLAGSSRVAPTPNLRFSSESSSYGGFVNLKLTAEKLVKEQASLKMDLEMAHAKLKKATDQIHALESKLQLAVNENAKLKVAQTEDVKLWKGLDSKLSSTKALCDQLTETLHYLAGQTSTAEEDKKVFESSLEQNSKAMDEFNFLVNELSAKLDCANNKINAGQQELMELKLEKEKIEINFRDEQCATNSVIMERDLVIKQLEEAATADKKQLYALDSQLQDLQRELGVRDDTCKCLRVTLSHLESERDSLQFSNQSYAQKLDKAYYECEELKEFSNNLVAKIVELDKHNATASEYIAKLLNSIELYYNLVKQEKDLSLRSAQVKFDKLQNEFMHVASEHTIVKEESENLKSKIVELQKAQEFIMVQHADECRLAEDKLRKLESEAECLISKKKELEKLVTELEDRNKNLTEASSITESQMQDLLQKVLQLETENHGLYDKMQSASHERNRDMEALQNEMSNRDRKVESLENQIKHLQITLDEKEQLNTCLLSKEKQLEEQKSEVQASLTMTESKLAEAKKQYDLMLERKELELSKHLKELSQRNDQAINEIRKKYDLEKLDIANSEKEKTEKVIKEMETKYGERILKNEAEAKLYLLRLKEEHDATISRIHQDYDFKESNLRAQQKEELQRTCLQAENELREKTASLRKEHEIQIKALKLQHEDDYKKLQEELGIQKSKEEKQKALLQLQWKIMAENQQVDQEVNSKKEYSVSSVRMRDPYARKEQKLHLASPEIRRKDMSMSGIMRTPVANILKKVEKRRTRRHHEYEVNSHGRAITKRQKTRNTVIFEDTNTQKVVNNMSPTRSHDVMKIAKAIRGPDPEAANIGDLFSEGSLNPYNDDPYAFDRQ